MGKWQPVNPADLREFEEAKAVIDCGLNVVGEFFTSSDGKVGFQGLTMRFNPADEGIQWFRRKPAKPTRPAEPPAGTVVRKVSTGEVGVRETHVGFPPWNVTDPASTRGPVPKFWNEWIAPGDEIEIGEWVKP